MISTVQAWLFDRAEPPAVVVTSDPAVIQLTAACSTGGEQWWFDVLSASPEIRLVEEYVLTKRGDELFCRDYELELSYPTVCRRHRRFEGDVSGEQILLCLPRPLSAQFAKLLKRCASGGARRPRKNLGTYCNDACAALAASIGHCSASSANQRLH